MGNTAGGARGIVLDGFIRDLLGLEVIPNYTVCARGTSPVESAQRWRMNAVNVPIAMPGTLTSQVRIMPGDWIVGGPDGVIVVPQDIATEALGATRSGEAQVPHKKRTSTDYTLTVVFEQAGREKWMCGAR